MNYLKLVPHIGLFVFLLPFKALTRLKHFISSSEMVVKHDTSLFSHHLQRGIVMDIVLPPNYEATNTSYPVLYMNDGQDLERLQMVRVLSELYHQQQVPSFILVAVHCGERIQEYGTAIQADYKQRGAKAGAYTSFVLEELLPYIKSHYRALHGPQHTAFCGFSLSGLSAFDIVWHHPEVFGKAGAFSGSFWWRQRAYENHYDDHQDRIMHRLVRESSVRREHFKDYTPAFWFQTGTDDEKDDRNHNGVIDSIEDTLDLVAELERKGFRWGKEARYVEVKGGRHDQATWSQIMPEFLQWAFKK
jgi:enterochelin esterase-like enzyme